jgi:signal transduction histidine kinase
MQDSGGTLTVKARREHRHVAIAVSDSGIGLVAGNADKMFSPFFTTKPDGSGMGLAISRSIIETHGGQLWATSNPDRGATFHFTLPAIVPATGTPSASLLHSELPGSNSGAV